MDPEDQTEPLLAPTAEYLASVVVFPLIPYLKKDVITTIDSALSWEQLTASDINFSIVRPLVFKYAKLKNMAVVYACLVVRSYFLTESETNLAYSGVMLARANLCEIMAMKLLSLFASNHMQLVAVLTTGWHPLAGAPADIMEEVKQTIGGDEDDLNCPQSALEMAISTKAKAFLSSPVSQKVVNDMYTGQIVFSMASKNSILADNYKPRAIEMHDYRKAPFLNHYRLRVPKYNAILEFLHFSVLLFTFVLCLSTKDIHAVSFWEKAFIVIATGFTLAEYTASQEHGWIIYIANMWNLFDTAFILVFVTYLVFRIKGLVNGNDYSSEFGFDVLACGACILFPRLAFFVVSHNVVVLSLRAMIAEFLFFLTIAAICFSGLLFTLWTLGTASDRWTVSGITWLMVQIWFGNTYLSFAQATSFHPVFGPILMTIFAALSNTLLLTILISILSNTVARIDANANQEYLFQFAISTIEGVKSDALFSYQPPFNLLAFVILKPASYIVTARFLHSLNVFLLKLTSFPILIVISLYERYLSEGQRIRTSSKDAAHSILNSLPRRIKNMPILETIVGSTPSDLYEAIFEVEVTHEFDLFGDSDDELPALRSLHSHDGIRPGEGPRRRPSSHPPSVRQSGGSPQRSPRQRNISLTPSHLTSAEVPNMGSRSPLAKLFAPRLPSSPVEAQGDSSVRRVETLLEEIRDLPVTKLKDEMKELQDRQARIENLLLMLTRGMRNEASQVPRGNPL